MSIIVCQEIFNMDELQMKDYLCQINYSIWLHMLNCGLTPQELEEFLAA